MAPEKYRGADRCIYDADHPGPFTDEHIVPFGLQPKGGDWFLPRASCAGCANITKRFEEQCLRGTFGLLREQLDLKTRRKKTRGKPIELVLEHLDGGSFDKIVDVAANLPQYCLSFKWQPPGLYRQASRTEVNFDGSEVILHTLKGKGGLQGLAPTIPQGQRLRLGSFNMLNYARMLAKIAHTFACAAFPLNAFQHSLPDLILGKNEYAPYLIGGDPRGTLPAIPDRLHELEFAEVSIGGTRYLSILIRLFAFCGAAGYLVIVGKLLNDADLLGQRLPPLR